MNRALQVRLASELWSDKVRQADSQMISQCPLFNALGTCTTVSSTCHLLIHSYARSVLLLQVHPDKNPGDKEAATCAFQLMKGAYETMLEADMYGLVIGCELGV